MNRVKEKIAVVTGARLCYRHLDVTDAEGWRALFDFILSAFKRIDILVNNAGICLLKPITDMDFDEFQRVNKVNVFGAFIGTRAAILAMPRCAEEGIPASGSIINIALAAMPLSVLSKRGRKSCLPAGIKSVPMKHWQW